MTPHIHDDEAGEGTEIVTYPPGHPRSKEPLPGSLPTQESDAGPAAVERPAGEAPPVATARGDLGAIAPTPAPWRFSVEERARIAAVAHEAWREWVKQNGGSVPEHWKNLSDGEREEASFLIERMYSWPRSMHHPGVREAIFGAMAQALAE